MVQTHALTASASKGGGGVQGTNVVMMPYIATCALMLQ